jgi:ligand-binding sensor domain-containing protein
MRYRIPSLLVACLLCLVRTLPAQQGLISPIGGWAAYLSHMTTKEMAMRGDDLFVITTGGMYRYGHFSGEIKQYSTVDGLSGIDPRTIFADSVTGNVFIGYQDGMINYLDRNEKLYYISDIARSELFTTKGINRMVSAGGRLYIATQFGLVVYDLARRETMLSVTKVGINPGGSEVKSVAIADGHVWVAMGALGIWTADLQHPNIGKPDAWQKVGGTDGLPDVGGHSLCAAQGKLFVVLNDSIYERPTGGGWVPSAFPHADYVYINANEGHVFACHRPSALYLLRPNGVLDTIDRDGSITCAWYTRVITYVGDATVGMTRDYQEGFFLQVTPPGPRNNFVTDLAAGNGELYIAPRGKNGSTNRYYDKSGIPYFNLHDGGWTIHDQRSGTLTVGDVYQDFARAAFDKVTGNCVVGSWGEGIVQLKEGKVVRTYSSANSGLTNSAAGHRVSGLAYDDVGNLWITQALGDYTLNVLTPDSQWYAFNPMAGLLPVGIVTDGYGNKWIIDQDQGLVVFNDNYTPADRSDDRVRELNANFGTGGLPNNSVRALAIDQDQQMWIGTTDGVTILYDPSILWQPEFQDAACPLIDGYCLLRGQEVFDIAVDGANRKWIATNNGVYLVNLDGTALLAHYTVENSPLPDNEVVALAIDHSTGEVFMGTGLGTVSFMGDAIDGQPDAAALYVFPNPVAWDHDGTIMIKGMPQNSQVKIATVAGQVVRELDSFGGEVAWDGLDAFGRRANPGIYLVMVADREGKGAGIVKFAILERPQ